MNPFQILEWSHTASFAAFNALVCVGVLFPVAMSRDGICHCFAERHVSCSSICRLHAIAMRINPVLSCAFNVHLCNILPLSYPFSQVLI